MRKQSLIALTLAFGSLLACDGSPPLAQNSDPGTPAAQAAAPEADTTESAISPPAPYDRLELLTQQSEQETLAQMADQFPEMLPRFAVPEDLPPDSRLPVLPGYLLDYSPPAVPGYLEQFERGLPMQENWMNCSGYITNNATAGFCEDEPPPNWRRFEFNDETLYFVPLGPSA